MSQYEIEQSRNELARLYQEQYRTCSEQLTQLSKLLAEHTKHQYMDPDNLNYAHELSVLQNLLEQCVEQLTEQ